MGPWAKIGMRVMSMVIAIPVSIVTKKIVERAWSTARPDDPPRKPTESEVRWADAIAWAAVSAIGIVVSDLVTPPRAPPRAKPHRQKKKRRGAGEKPRATPDCPPPGAR